MNIPPCRAGVMENETSNTSLPFLEDEDQAAEIITIPEVQDVSLCLL